MFKLVNQRFWLFVALLSATIPISVALSKSATIAAPAVTAQTSDFFTIREDLRKCASPMCGGYFVKRVNQPTTLCANGRNMSECYVASIDWNGAAEVDAKRALIRGTIETRGDRNGKYGVLRVTEVWQALNDDEPSGDYFRVKDTGVRCVAAPCNSYSEAKLNTKLEQKIAGVSSSSDENSEQWAQARKAMTGEDGVVVVGLHAPVSGPAGRSQTLKVSQFYLRKNSAVALKPCIKTGCSGQVCSDHDVITTCIYRTEYECYKKATCERQSDGNCGWTKTPELTSCLRSRG
jgi:hypothetical protein